MRRRSIITIGLAVILTMSVLAIEASFPGYMRVLAFSSFYQDELDLLLDLAEEDAIECHSLKYIEPKMMCYPREGSLDHYPLKADRQELYTPVTEKLPGIAVFRAFLEHKVVYTLPSVEQGIVFDRKVEGAYWSWFTDIVNSQPKNAYPLCDWFEVNGSFRRATEGRVCQLPLVGRYHFEYFWVYSNLNDPLFES